MAKTRARKNGKKKQSAKATKKMISRITVKYDVGFNNRLYIRGNGGGLNWDHGQVLRNVGPDEWVWETTVPIKDCEFKVLINDSWYEAGENHHLPGGAWVKYNPSFPNE